MENLISRFKKIMKNEKSSENDENDIIENKNNDFSQSTADFGSTTAFKVNNCLIMFNL